MNVELTSRPIRRIELLRSGLAVSWSRTLVASVSAASVFFIMTSWLFLQLDMLMWSGMWHYIDTFSTYGRVWSTKPKLWALSSSLAVVLASTAFVSVGWMASLRAREERVALSRVQRALGFAIPVVTISYANLVYRTMFAVAFLAADDPSIRSPVIARAMWRDDSPQIGCLDLLVFTSLLTQVFITTAAWPLLPRFRIGRPVFALTIALLAVIAVTTTVTRTHLNIYTSNGERVHALASQDTPETDLFARRQTERSRELVLSRWSTIDWRRQFRFVHTRGMRIGEICLLPVTSICSASGLTLQLDDGPVVEPELVFELPYLGEEVWVYPYGAPDTRQAQQFSLRNAASQLTIPKGVLLKCDVNRPAYDCLRLIGQLRHEGAATLIVSAIPIGLDTAPADRPLVRLVSPRDSKSGLQDFRPSDKRKPDSYPYSIAGGDVGDASWDIKALHRELSGLNWPTTAPPSVRIVPCWHGEEREEWRHVLQAVERAWLAGARELHIDMGLFVDNAFCEQQLDSSAQESSSDSTARNAS